VAKSSIESELEAVEEFVPCVLWITLMQDLNLNVGKPVHIMQDNLSAIRIINNGGCFSRSKQMVARHGFIKQHVELKDITFKHCPSGYAYQTTGRIKTEKVKQTCFIDRYSRVNTSPKYIRFILYIFMLTLYKSELIHCDVVSDLVVDLLTSYF